MTVHHGPLTALFSEEIFERLLTTSATWNHGANFQEIVANSRLNFFAFFFFKNSQLSIYFHQSF